MINGRAILLELIKASGDTAPFYTYHGLVIKNSALYRGISLYEKAIWKFLGNSMISRLQRKNIQGGKDILKMAQLTRWKRLMPPSGRYMKTTIPMNGHGQLM
jgi:hypothetical protein